VTAALDIAVPFITRGVIDGVVRSLQFAKPDALRSLLLAAGAILGITVVTRVLRSVYNYRLFRVISVAEDQVKNAAFANFLSLDTEYHGNVNTGEVIGALDRGGTASFVILYEIFGQNLLPPTLVLLGVLTALLMKNAWIAAIVFLPLPAYAIAVGRLSGRMHRLEYLISHSFERVTKESFDIASNVRVVKKFSRERQEARKQRDLLYRARTHHYSGERLWAFIENVQSLFSTAGRVGVIALGGFLVLTHRCTVGEYVLFIAMQDMVYGPISQLSIILPKLRRNLSRAERMFEILEQGRKVCDVPHAKQLTGPGRSVKFCNLSFKYAGAEQWTLRDVNFEIPAGSTVALIGPSGSGKSTLMNLLQRLYDPQAGSVLIDGEDIRLMSQSSLREQISVVPQEVELFSRSILENIGYGKDQVERAEVERAAQMAQAHEFIMRCEDGYDTQVGERGMKLSGGERQRIGIARAIVRDPKILILDEATSHLDNESERLIQVAMEKITKGRTCFIIAHRLSTVRKADIVVVFNHNTVEAVGTHEELWHSSPTYRKLHGIHVAEMPKRPAASVAEQEAELQPVAVGE
jgi:ABC-type multidrug transport system fused ATPase/permease subunit